MLNRNVYSLVVRFSGRKEMVRAAARKSIIDDARMGFGMLEQQNLQTATRVSFGKAISNFQSQILGHFRNDKNSK